MRPEHEDPEHEDPENEDPVRLDQGVLARRLAGAGYRVTTQRLGVWHAIETGTPHATMLDVFATVTATFPTVSLRTVYETVHLYENLGLLRVIHLPGGARIERDMNPHGHACCEGCGAIINVSHQSATPGTVTPEGFHVRVTEDVVIGRCLACAAAES